MKMTFWPYFGKKTLAKLILVQFATLKLMHHNDQLTTSREEGHVFFPLLENSSKFLRMSLWLLLYSAKNYFCTIGNIDMKGHRNLSI